MSSWARPRARAFAGEAAIVRGLFEIGQGKNYVDEPYEARIRAA